MSMEIQSLLLIDEESEAKYTKLPGCRTQQLAAELRLASRVLQGYLSSDWPFLCFIPQYVPPSASMPLREEKGREDSR